MVDNDWNPPEKPTVIAGAVIEVGHPFIRAPYTAHDGEGGNFEVIGWRPGTRAEQTSPDDGEDFADATGTQILTVVSIHKPGRFPMRVFYTRQWRDPDGREFGKAHLRVTTMQAFQTLIKGYRWPYEIAEAPTMIEKQVANG